MAFRERIEVVVDFVTTGAKTGLGKLAADVKAADGATGKLKAGFGGLKSAVSSMGPQIIATGAAFVGSIGVKAVNAFYDAALAAGEFADKTGLTVEQASRFTAVADDMGISTEQLTAVFGKMNQAIGSGKFEKLGLDIVRAADGTVDANATFIQTATAIGKIPDAAERARLAQQVFGKSWGEVSRLMQMDAEQLTRALEGVSDAQVIDSKELARAREMQAAFDKLKDAGEDLMVTLGGELAPAVTELADLAGDVAGAWDKIPGVFRDVATMSPLGEFRDLVNGSDELTGIVSSLERELKSAADAEAEAAEEAAAQAEAAWEQSDANMSAAESMDAAAKSADGLRTAQENLIGKERDKLENYRAAEESAKEYQDALKELGGTLLDGEKSEDDKAAATRKAADAAIKASKDIAIFKNGTLDSKNAVRDQITALSDMAKGLEPGSPLRRQLNDYINQLKGIERNITTTVSVQYLDNGNGPMVDENGNLHTTGGRLAPDDGKGAGRPAMQDDTALWAQGAGAMGDARGAQPSAADRKRQAFDREMEILKRKYEVGDITADEYLNALTRLGQKYKWKRLSDPWMALWREKQQARKDAREAAAEAAAADQGGDLTKAPGKGVDGDGPAITKTPKMGAAPRMGGRSGSGAGVVINAIVMNRKDVERLASELDPILARVSARRERGES